MSKQISKRIISGDSRCYKHNTTDRVTGVREAGLDEVVRKGFLEVVTTLKPKDEKESSLRRSQGKTSWQSK